MARSDVMRILLVDDCEINCSLFTAMLANEPWEAAAYSSVEAALQALQRGRFDLIILDRQMPEMSGVELCKTIRRRWPESMSLIGLVSAANDDEGLKEEARHGFDFVLPKPLGYATLVELVEEAKRRKSAAAKALTNRRAILQELPAVRR